MSGPGLDKEKRADAEKAKGNDCFKSGDLQGAMVHFSQSIDIFPTAATYSNRAMVYIKLGKFSMAEADCDKVLQLEPNNVKALLRRGIARQELTHYDEAIADFKAALALDKNAPEAKDRMKRCEELKVSKKARTEDKKDEEEEDAGKIDMRTRVKIQELKEHGTELYKKQKFEEAIRYFTQAIDACPADAVETRASLYNNRGGCYKQLQQDAEVVRDCTECVSLTSNPDKKFKALLRRALSYEGIDKAERALADYDEVLRIDPNNVMAKQGHARVFTVVQKSREVRAVEAKEKGAAAYQAGNLEEALSFFNKGLESAFEKKNKVALLGNRCLVLGKLKRHAEVVADATNVISLDAGNAKAYFRRGQARKELGELKEAEADLLQSVKLDASNKAAAEPLLAEIRARK